jgi:hypothetical protein
LDRTNLKDNSTSPTATTLWTCRSWKWNAQDSWLDGTCKASRADFATPHDEHARCRRAHRPNATGAGTHTNGAVPKRRVVERHLQATHLLTLSTPPEAPLQHPGILSPTHFTAFPSITSTIAKIPRHHDQMHRHVTPSHSIQHSTCTQHCAPSIR